MTGYVLIQYDTTDGIVTLTLNRPARHNALVPELLAGLNAALQRAANETPAALVLRGAGRSFSSGGDVRRFHDTARSERRAYAADLVGALNTAILALLDMPCPTIAAVHGMVTGGALGLVLACDMVIGSPRAQFAPWYVEVGFSPDGGWTALLPERIGRARALEIQLLNRRVEADEALRLGLLHALVPETELDAAIAQRLAALARAKPGSVRHTLALMRPDLARVAARLESEREHFLAQIETAEAADGMAAFLRLSA